VAAAPAIIIGDSFRLADRIKIQCDRIRQKDYIVFGRITAIHWEDQRNISGLSQSRPRYTNPNQSKFIADAVAKGLISEHTADAIKPFSEKQNMLWQSTTMDWLDQKRGPLIARSRDQRDWLLPQGLSPLPPIPDPRFVPTHARSLCRNGKDGCNGCSPPRIPQLLVGCPIVGDRVRHRITSHNGYTMGVIRKLLELSVVAWAPDGTGHFLRLRGSEDNVDRSRPALLIDDENRGFLVGGVLA
jgi:hypothetical protein